MKTNEGRTDTRKARFTKDTARGSVLLWILGSLAAGFILAVALVINALTLDREARVVRQAMVSALDARISTRVQVSAGPLMLGGARTLLGFVDHLPDEARIALRSVRSASVGVYSLNRDPGRRYDRVLGQADAAMARQGWSRLVGVVQPQKKTCVLIYTPTHLTDDEAVRVCVAVCDGRDLVVVSAKTAPEELVKLAAKHSASVRL